MFSRNGKYNSVFKIDGIPILPPLMTEEKRREMLYLRDLAATIEKKLKRRQRMNSAREINEIESDNEYMKVSSFLQQRSNSLPDTVSSCPIPPPSAKNVPEKKINLQKSDTFIFDIGTNVVIIPQLGDLHTTDEFPSAFRNVSEVPSSPYQANNESYKKVRSDFSVNNENPTISIVPPTPDNDVDVKKDLIKNEQITGRKSREAKNESPKTPKRSSTSPSLQILSEENISSPRRIIRSNSFTLDGPSPFLLRHLAKAQQAMKDEVRSINAEKSPNKWKESFTADLMASQYHKSPEKQKKPELGVVGKTTSPFISNIGNTKQKRSPYETKVSSKTKLLRKYKIPLKKSMSTVSIKKKTVSARNPSFDKNTPSSLTFLDNKEALQGIFEKIENEHNLKLMQLLKKQTEEQKRMQESFEKQQQMLLQQLNKDIMTLKLESSKNPIKNVNHPSVDDLGMRSISYRQTFKSPNSSRDQQHSVDSSKTKLAAERDQNVVSISGRTKSPNCSRRLFFVELSPSRKINNVQSKKEEAATKINACVRGYLVRRLFRTEYIRRIVQTIQDTLLFVLDLHKETLNDDSPVNIELKAQLLQQLTSACYMLNNIFCDISIKQRMEIIARDRRYMKRRSINRTISP